MYDIKKTQQIGKLVLTYLHGINYVPALQYVGFHHRQGTKFTTNEMICSKLSSRKKWCLLCEIDILMVAKWGQKKV